MKSAARLKPKAKAGASSDKYFGYVAQAKAAKHTQNQKKKQSHPHESQHVRGMQLGMAASMLYTMNEWLASSDEKPDNVV